MNPRLAAAYEKRGVLYYFQEKYKEMLEDYLRLAELEPSDSEAQLMLGVAYLNSENYDRAIELGGNKQATSRAYTTRAKAYLQLGRTTLADRDIRRSLKLDPSFFFYIHPTMTDFLADYVTDFDQEGSKGIRWLGFLGLLALSCVLIFRFTLPAPHKSDDN